MENLKVSAEAVDIFAKEAATLDTNAADTAPMMLASIPRSLMSGIVKRARSRLEFASALRRQVLQELQCPAVAKSRGRGEQWYRFVASARPLLRQISLKQSMSSVAVAPADL